MGNVPERRFAMTTTTKTHRFSMRITQMSQVLLIPFGVLARRAYASIHGEKLHVRFGPMFDEEISLANIESAEEAHWPRWAGVGARTNFRGSVGVIGSYQNIVKLTLKEPVDVHVYLVPTKCRYLFFSLEEPEEFLKELGFLHTGRSAKAA
jgi:hypothetical protein